MATLTKAEIELLDKLGITHDAVTKAQAAKARAAMVDKARALLADPVTQVIADAEMTQSAKSAWTGTTVSFDLGDYGVKVVVTDKAATKAREAALKAG